MERPSMHGMFHHTLLTAHPDGRPFIRPEKLVDDDVGQPIEADHSHKETLDIQGHHTSSCGLPRHNGTKRSCVPNYGKTCCESRHGLEFNCTYFVVEHLQSWLKSSWNSMEACA